MKMTEKSMTKQSMTEQSIAMVMQRLRLFARRDVVCDQYGHRIGGEMDAEVESLHVQVDRIHDHVLDGVTLTRDEVVFMQYCQTVVNEHREVIRQLERAYAC